MSGDGVGAMSGVNPEADRRRIPRVRISRHQTRRKPRNGHHPRACRWNRDRGAAGLAVLGAGCALVVLAAGVMVAAQVLVARHRARTAADLAALAGAVVAAQGSLEACAHADRAAASNGASLVACRVDGLDVTVSVNVRAGIGRASGVARAGPRQRSAVTAGDP